MTEPKKNLPETDELSDAQLSKVAGGFQSAEHGTGGTFLKLQPIDGESTTATHSPEIQ